MLIRTGVRIIHAVEIEGGTKPMSMSTRGQGWCPAVEKLASLQQAPGSLHVETWSGRGDNPSLWISQVVEIMPVCADTVVRLPSPFLSSVSPGPGREVRNGMDWSLMEKTARSGVWLFRGALSGNSAFFVFAAFVSWVWKGSFLPLPQPSMKKALDDEELFIIEGSQLRKLALNSRKPEERENGAKCDKKPFTAVITQLL